MKDNDIISITNLASLGRTVALYRKSMRFTQQELAEEIGVSRVWVSDLERGELTNPGFDRLLAVFDLLRIGFAAVPASGSSNSDITNALIDKRKQYERRSLAAGEIL